MAEDGLSISNVVRKAFDKACRELGDAANKAGYQVDFWKFPKTENKNKGVSVESNPNDRTQNLQVVKKPIDAFLGPDENGRILNQGNAAERLNAYLIAKFGTNNIERTLENKQRAVDMINNLMGGLTGNPAASAVNDAGNEWLRTHFN